MRGRHADLARDRAHLLGGAAVRAALLDGDLAPHEILVDGLGRALDPLARDGVLRRRPLALGHGRTDREGQLDLLDDPLEEEVTFGGLERLRVLLRLGQGPELVLELLAHGPLDGGEALLVEDERQARARLQLTDDVLLGRVHRDLPAELHHELLDRSPGLAQALAPGSAPRSRGRASPPAPRSGRDRATWPCRPGAASSSWASHSFTISRCASSKASRIVSSGTCSAPASTIVSASFVPTTIRSSELSSSVSCSVGLTTSRRRDGRRGRRPPGRGRASARSSAPRRRR